MARSPWRNLETLTVGTATAAPVGCQKPMEKGDPIAKIVDIWGDTQGELFAPADGMIFDLRALPNVTTGDRCRCYAKLNGRD